jgi:hypothetical protein
MGLNAVIVTRDYMNKWLCAFILLSALWYLFLCIGIGYAVLVQW